MALPHGDNGQSPMHERPQPLPIVEAPEAPHLVDCRGAPSALDWTRTRQEVGSVCAASSLQAGSALPCPRRPLQGLQLGVGWGRAGGRCFVALVEFSLAAERRGLPAMAAGGHEMPGVVTFCGPFQPCFVCWGTLQVAALATCCRVWQKNSGDLPSVAPAGPW